MNRWLQPHLPVAVRGLLLACLVAVAAFATEHHGTVQFGGMPVPGAMVTATKDGKRLVAITDDRGAYSFPDLADGVWTIQVEMLCFETITREVAIQADAPPPTWELKLLPPGQMHTVQEQAAPPKTATPTEPTAAAAAPASATTGDGAKSAKGNGKNAQATAPAQNGFQRTDLRASADAGSISAEAPTPGDATQRFQRRFYGERQHEPARLLLMRNRRHRQRPERAKVSVSSRVERNRNNSALDAKPFSVNGAQTPKLAFNQLNGAASIRVSG